MSIANISSIPTLQEIRRGWLDEKRCLTVQIAEAREKSITYISLLNKRYHEEQQQRHALVHMLETNLAKVTDDLAELDQRIAALSAPHN